MVTKRIQVEIPLDKIIANTEQSDNVFYANFVGLALTDNEIVIDLYAVTPQAGKPEKLNGVHQARAIMPAAVAERLAGALSRLLEDRNDKSLEGLGENPKLLGEATE